MEFKVAAHSIDIGGVFAGQEAEVESLIAETLCGSHDEDIAHIAFGTEAPEVLVGAEGGLEASSDLECVGC